MKKNFQSVVNLLSVLSQPLSIIALTETWLTVLNQDAYTIPGYSFVSQSRIDKLGGGVGIFVNVDLVYNLPNDLCRNSTYIECLFIELAQNAKSSILIGCIYRPPNSDLTLYNSEIVSLLKTIDSEKHSFVLLAGDYNLDLLQYESHGPTGEFLNNLLCHSYLPTICNPTRITESSATLIDNIFINTTRLKSSSAIVYSDISDHLPVILHLETSLIKRTRPTVIKKRIYSQIAIENFNNDLAIYDNWRSVYDHCSSGQDASNAYDLFHNQYNIIFNKHFPLKSLKCSYRLTPRHEWMTKGLIKSCLKKSKLYKKYRKTGKTVDKNCFVAYKKKLKHLLKVAEKTYYFDKFKSVSGNLRKTWKLLSSFTGKTQNESISDFFIVDGTTITNKSVIAEKLNEYFVDIGSRLASTIPPANSRFLTTSINPI